MLLLCSPGCSLLSHAYKNLKDLQQASSLPVSTLSVWVLSFRPCLGPDSKKALVDHERPSIDLGAKITSMVAMTKKGPWFWQASPTQLRHNHSQHQASTWIPQLTYSQVFRLLNPTVVRIKSSGKMNPQHKFSVQRPLWSWFFSRCNHYG